MKLRELIQYTKHLLKGRRTKTSLICLLPLGAELFFRSAEACVYSLLLYFGEISPIMLFSGNSTVQLAFTSLCTLLRWIVTAPLINAAAFRLCGICGNADKGDTPLSEIMLNRRFFRRSLSALLWTKIVGLITLIPAVFFGVTAYSLLISSHSAKELFMTAHAIVLTVVSIVMWLSLKLSLMAVPFLLVQFPKKSVFRVVRESIGFMSGRKSALVKLMAVYLPPMLTVAALPFLLPELMTAFSLSIDIYIKEDEYLERNKTDCGIRQAPDSAKLPHRKKRRFKAAADKA